MLLSPTDDHAIIIDLSLDFENKISNKKNCKTLLLIKYLKIQHYTRSIYLRILTKNVPQ